MANQNNQNAGPTEILCRLDANTRKAVVFIAHTFHNNQIQMWDGGDDLKFVPVHEYQRTLPLAKADEEHIAQRFNRKFKDTAVVRHRLPRQQQERTALFAPKANETEQKDNDQQKALPAPAEGGKPATPPASNVVSLPTANALSAAPAVSLLPTASPLVLPVSQMTSEIPKTDLSSSDLLGKITEEGGKLRTLAELVANLTQQLQQATADHAASNQAYAILAAQYQIATDREAEEERQRKQAALDAALAPLIALREEANAQPTAEVQPLPAKQPEQPEQQKQAPAEGTKPATPRGAGGKFQKKTEGGSGKAKTIEQQTPPNMASTVEMLKGFSPEQLQAIAKEAGINLQPA